MLQRSLPSTPSAELADSLQRTLDRRWARSLQDSLPLPQTWQQYLLSLAITLVIAGGLALHVLLSVQIAEGEYQVRMLRAEVQRIERDNSDLVYQIAMRSSLTQIEIEAAKQGFGPATERVFVHRPQTTASNVPGLLPQPVGANSSTELNPSSRELTSDWGPAEATGPPASQDWLGQGVQWWQSTQQSAQVAVDQLMRDATGQE
jgi:hypothetical protein